MRNDNTKKIIKYPDPTLRKRSEEVKEITPEIKKLIEGMKGVLAESQGIGLAAPQVGVLKRVIVVGVEKSPLVLINPKILRKSKEIELGEEGCLSLPGLYLKIKRSKFIEVEALDIDGKKIHFGTRELFPKAFTAERYPAGVIIARIIQHEIDHLDGILIIDRIPFWQRWKVRKKLK